jgi:iron complex outermembrane receptor protein
VQQTPSDTETEGLTYQRKAWDTGIFNKRIGTFYIDNGNLTGYTFHNQYTIEPFGVTNAFINYTMRTGGRFDQTKFRLSFNNVFNSSQVNGITLSASPTPQAISANGTTYNNPFLASTAISGQDNISINPGRSIMLTVTFGYNPGRR